MKTFTKTLFTGLFFLLLSFNINAQGLWGMTSKGGDEDMGVIFKTNTDGTNYTVVKSFGKGFPGDEPGLLVDGGNGILYGMTEDGGKNNLGVIFKYDYVSDVYTVLYNFGENGETYNPDINSLVLSNNNKLYGYSKKNYNNSLDYGVLFKLDLSNNSFSEIHDFSMARPVGRLILASDGNVYGCQAEVYTLSNNDPDFGWIIGINTNSDNVFTVHEFDADTEGLPTDGLVENNGILYGITKTKKTTIFKYDLSSSTYTILEDMSLTDIDFEGSPVYADEKIYGITRNGTSSGSGGVYRYDIANDVFSFVHVFNTEREEPNANVIMAKDGCLYGTTFIRGNSDNGEYGVLYKLSFSETTSGTYSVLHTYTCAFHGEYLTEAGNYGNIYITDLGDGNDLNVWVPATNTYKFKFKFTRYETGRYPKGSLAVNRYKTLTGFTSGGGRTDVGTEFKYDNTDSDIYHSSLNDGHSDINGEVTLFTKNNVPVELVLTKSGGDNNKGCIYDMDWVVYSFDGTNGAYPNGSLIKAANGKLYGLTSGGGDNDKGVIFEYDYQPLPAVYTKLVDFDGTNGANPYGSLLEASDGRLYGTTSKGGDNDMGTIFYYNTSTNPYVRVFDKVADFNGTNGKYPLGDLVETDNGIFYGLTSEGGANNCGVIFEYDLNTHSLTVKHNFSSASGKNPKGSMTKGKDGVLFGLTNSGGTYDKGVMFSFDPATGDYNVLVSFDGTNGANPEYTKLLMIDITPENETLPALNGQCEVDVTEYPTAVNTYGDVITGTPSVTFPVTAQGTTTVTWTYDDGKGNVTSQEQAVIVDDTEDPVVDEENLPDLHGDCRINDPQRNRPKATDNCVGQITASADVSFPITEEGTTVITWTYDDGNGNIVTQTQNAIVGIDNTVTVNGNVLTANAEGGYTYQWYQRAGSWTILLQNETGRSYTAGESGTFYVEVSNGTCSVTSDDISVDVSTGINDGTEMSGISVYPNPVSSVLNIENTLNRDLIISVYDYTGNKIKNVKASDPVVKLNVEDLVKGVYFIVINNGESAFTKKVIKK